jgi:hypothetical protein
VKYASELVDRSADKWHTHTGTRDMRATDYAPARLGLRESLEDYAGRFGVRVHVARPHWRREGLRLLGVTAPANVHAGLCAIAPGVAVPTAFVDWPDDFDGGAS